MAIDAKPVRDDLDWLLALFGHKPGEILTLTLDRTDGPREVPLKLEHYPVAEVAPPDGKSPGLHYEVYHGQADSVTDLGRLESVARGVVDGLDLARLEGVRVENFAVVFDGYLEIPETGVYHLILGSDDGSRLSLDGQIIVDNDGNHPDQKARGIRRLARGLHRMRLEYISQGGWGSSLDLRLERDHTTPGEVTGPVRFFRD